MARDPRLTLGSIPRPAEGVSGEAAARLFGVQRTSINGSSMLATPARVRVSSRRGSPAGSEILTCNNGRNHCGGDDGDAAKNVDSIVCPVRKPQHLWPGISGMGARRRALAQPYPVYD